MHYTHESGSLHLKNNREASEIHKWILNPLVVRIFINLSSSSSFASLFAVFFCADLWVGIYVGIQKRMLLLFRSAFYFFAPSHSSSAFSSSHTTKISPFYLEKWKKNKKDLEFFPWRNWITSMDLLSQYYMKSKLGKQKSISRNFHNTHIRTSSIPHLSSVLWLAIHFCLFL